MARPSLGACQGWFWRYRFRLARHSHGGTGLGSAHRPRIPAPAYRSYCSSAASPAAYIFQYQQYSSR